jgi:hypothetical protein
MPEGFLYNVDFNKNQALNLLLQIIAGNHASPVEGSIWYDSTAQAIKFRDSDSTNTLGVAGAGGDADTLDGNDSTYFLARANHSGTQLAATISDFAAAVAALSIDADLLNGENAAYYRARANHTGTQLAATISDFAAAVAALSIDADTLEGEPLADILARANHTGTQLAATISDFNSAVASAIPGSYATDAEVTAAINAVIDAAPGTLDTLNELAAALGDDPNFATTLTNQIATKAGKFAASYGDGSTTTFDIAHSLGTRDVIAAVYEVASPYARVYPGIRNHDANTVRLVHSVAPSSNQYRVVCIGG